jgi:hypothetical protein
MSKEYKKKCSTCQTEIIMSDASGKWSAFETDNATIHRCIKKDEKPPSRPPMMTEQQQTKQQEQQQPFVSVNKDYEIAELKKRLAKVESWIKKFSESAAMNL